MLRAAAPHRPLPVAATAGSGVLCGDRTVGRHRDGLSPAGEMVYNGTHGDTCYYVNCSLNCTFEIDLQLALPVHAVHALNVDARSDTQHIHAHHPATHHVQHAGHLHPPRLPGLRPSQEGQWPWRLRSPRRWTRCPGLKPQGCPPAPDVPSRPRRAEPSGHRACRALPALAHALLAGPRCSCLHPPRGLRAQPLLSGLTPADPG